MTLTNMEKKWLQRDLASSLQFTGMTVQKDYLSNGSAFFQQQRIALRNLIGRDPQLA